MLDIYSPVASIFLWQLLIQLPDRIYPATAKTIEIDVVDYEK
ncbi:MULTISPECIES: hypothetical protein [unclassified Microcoleus]